MADGGQGTINGLNVGPFGAVLGLLADVTALVAIIGEQSTLALVFAIGAIVFSGASMFAYVRGGKRYWALTAFILALAGMALVVWSLGAKLSDSSSAGGSSSNSATSPPNSAAPSCSELRTPQAIQQAVEPLVPGSPQLKIESAYSVVSGGSYPFIQLSGQLKLGQVGAQVPYLLSESEEFPRSKTGDKGSGGTYPIQPLQIADGCWSVPTRRTGYEGAQGLVFRQIIVLATPDQMRLFDQYQALPKGSQKSKDGLTEAEIRAAGIVYVAAFNVQT